MRRKPSVTTAIACAALFFSLAGTGLAASKYLITSKSQIAPNVLKAIKGKRGAPGPAGPVGSAGSVGTPGAAGASFSTSDVTVVAGATQVLCTYGAGTCDVAVASAACPAGSVAVGGGWDGGSSPPIDATVADNEPIATDSAWEIGIINDSSLVDATFTPYAVCAS